MIALAEKYFETHIHDTKNLSKLYSVYCMLSYTTQNCGQLLLIKNDKSVVPFFLVETNSLAFWIFSVKCDGFEISTINDSIESFIVYFLQIPLNLGLPAGYEAVCQVGRFEVLKLKRKQTHYIIKLNFVI